MFWTDKPFWQYNGVAPLAVIVDWCYAHLESDDWECNGSDTIFFKDIAIKEFFLLKWS